MATPVRSSGAEGLRPTPGDLFLILLVAAAAVALLFALRPQGGAEALTVRVTVDSEPVAEYALADYTEPVQVAVDGVSWPLVLELSADGVRVAESDCPGGDCLRTGAIHSAGEQIICLPNKLIVSLEGASNAPASDIDAVAG